MLLANLNHKLILPIGNGVIIGQPVDEAVLNVAS